MFWFQFLNLSIIVKKSLTHYHLMNTFVFVFWQHFQSISRLDWAGLAAKYKPTFNQTSDQISQICKRYK